LRGGREERGEVVEEVEGTKEWRGGGGMEEGREKRGVG
jgi:hypothetical protein